MKKFSYILFFMLYLSVFSKIYSNNISHQMFENTYNAIMKEKNKKNILLIIPIDTLLEVNLSEKLQKKRTELITGMQEKNISPEKQEKLSTELFLLELNNAKLTNDTIVTQLKKLQTLGVKTVGLSANFSQLLNDTLVKSLKNLGINLIPGSLSKETIQFPFKDAPSAVYQEGILFIDSDLAIPKDPQKYFETLLDTLIKKTKCTSTIIFCVGFTSPQQIK